MKAFASGTYFTSSRLERVRWSLVVEVLGLIFLMGLGPTFAQTTTLVPSSYVTTQGTDSGQPVSTLDELDERGTVNDWGKYVQFQAKAANTTYVGYRTYTLPASVEPTSVTSIQVQANYQGPAKSTQTWTWQIFDWVHNAYVTVGDNYAAPAWGPWTILSFNIAGNNLANYVGPSDGQIRLGLISNNTADNVDIDYEALVVTIGSNPHPFPLSFYVSTTGNDANPGTSSAPWRTISKAARTVGPGSTVYVRGGVYSERVVLNVSGSTLGGYIQFQSYPGETAIVDGTGVTMPIPGNTPTGLFQITNRSYVVVQGFEIRNYKTTSANLFPAGISITGTGDHIQIRHNKIHDIDNAYCDLSTEPCGAHGLAVYGTGAPNSINNLMIDGNELYNLILGQSESMTINGNVQYWSVTNNIVHDNNNIGIDAIGFEQTSPDPAYDQARDGYISGNLVYNISDNNNPAYSPNDNSANGIYVDGGTRITIERNIIHDCNIGLELASEHIGRTTSYVTARSNVIYFSTGPGISIGGFCDGSSSCGGVTTGSTDHCTIVNNTLFENDSFRTDGSGELQIQWFPSNVSDSTFENNILDANSQGMLISNPFPNPVVTLDYNLYYAPNGDPNNNTWQWNNTTYQTFSAYQSASGNDLISRFADPRFLNLSLPDLWVPSTSPAVNAGITLGPSVVGTLDLAGVSRVFGTSIDIGAYRVHLALDVTLSPQALVFPVQEVHTTSAPQKVRVVNPGDFTVTITSIVTRGDFAQSNDCPAALSLGARCELSVTFTPTTVGPRKGRITLSFIDDSGERGVLQVVLEGFGELPW